MIGKLGKFLSGVSLAIQVKTGHGRFHSASENALAKAEEVSQILPAQRTEILFATAQVRHEATQAALQTTPITALTEFGARVGAFSSVGIRYVSALQRLASTGSLERIPGVGSATSEAAINALKSFTAYTEKTVRLLPDADNRLPSDTRLLVGLARYELLARELPLRTVDLQTQAAELKASLREWQKNTDVASAFFSEINANRSKHTVVGWQRKVTGLTLKLNTC